MPIDALPSISRSDTDFRTKVDDYFLTKLPTFSTQAEEARLQIVAAESTTTSAASTASTDATTATTAANTATSARDSAVTAKNAAETAAAQAVSGNVATPIHEAVSKTTPVDADELGLSDSAASWGLKKLTFANLKTWLSGLYVGKTGAQTMTGDLTVPSLNGGQLAGMRNKIINGGLSVNQRAYVSGAATTAGQYTLDRWKVTGTGGVTFSTTANKTTVTIPSGQTLQQVIEGLNLQTGTYVLSWEGTAQGRIAGGSYGASGTVTASITGGTNTAIEFNAGTVTSVQLEAGTVATPFEHRPYGMELALCQRYFQVIADGTVNQTVATGVAISTTAGQSHRFISPPMRTSPTFSISAAGDFIAITATGTSAGSPTSITGAVLTPIYARIDFSGTGASLVSGNATSVQANATSARMYLSAEL